MEIDKTGLEGELFTVFAEMSKNMYIYICNMETGISRWSKSAVDYFGLPGEYFADCYNIWGSHVHPEDYNMYIEDLSAVLSGKKDKHDLQYRAKNKDGDYIMVTCRGYILESNGVYPKIFAGVLVNHGIIDNVDPVTNLYNIYGFMNAIKIHDFSKEPAAVMAIGINQFHYINTIYNYNSGNKVLYKFALKLTELVHSYGGSVYRMDGAKFALCINGMNKEQAKELFFKIQKIARKDIIINNVYIPLSISGGAVLVSNYSGGEYSIRNSVMYCLERSKRDRHSELVFFDDEESKKDNVKTLELLEAVRNSIVSDCNGFYLYYQPLVCAQNGKIVGAEALLRWKNKDNIEVSPNSFIPFMETDPCFYELGNWILHQALTDTKKIIESHPNFIINVNISYSQFERSGFRSSVINILKDTEFPAKNLSMELTERCRNLDTGYLEKEMNFFKNYGIDMVLDDFGTGAASLNLLSKLPIDCLKIDRSFISNIQTNDNDKTIVETIIQCAKKLGIRVCMEGIEDEPLKQYVSKYNADIHQGYHYSRPVPFNIFLELMRDNDVKFI